MEQTGNTILVTGAGSGIGRALAQRWHDQGNTVIVTGRHLDKLNETVGNNARMCAFSLDVDDAAAIRSFAARLVQEHPKLNVLVNNAGIYAAEDVTTQRDLAAAEAMLQTNLLGPIRMIDAFVDHLKLQAGAAIVNVSSGLAFVPLPAAPVYSAAKAAIHSYTLALRARLEGKVEVIEIVPPQVQTELTPGQSTAEGCVPLDVFADDVMALFAQQPTPPEICVEQVQYFRRAEAEGKTDEAIKMMNAYS